MKKTIWFVSVILLVCSIGFLKQVEALGKLNLLDDKAGLLSAEERTASERYLSFVRNVYKIDYRIVTITDLGGEDLNTFAVLEYEERNIGKDTEGRGLLLVLSDSEALCRVEVGYALEGYFTDAEASSILRDYLKPYYQNRQNRAAIESTIELLIIDLRNKMEAVKAQPEVMGTGGAGAAEDLFKSLGDKLDKETLRGLKSIMRPQATPEGSYRLELAMMAKGLYHYDLEIFDKQWRKRQKTMASRWSAVRLQNTVRMFSVPFKIYTKGKYAVIYYPNKKELGPTFLDKIADGWVLNRTDTAKYIHYNYESTGWFAYEGDYPHLMLLHKVLTLMRISLEGGQKAYMIEE